MGVEIVIFAEIKREDGWHIIKEKQGSKEIDLEIYNGRNYALFDILGGIGRSMGRTLNGREFEMIAPMRGIPKDMDAEEWESDYGNWCYNPSWLLLSEVLAFDWHGKFMQFEAMVEAEVAYLFQEHEPFPRDKWPINKPVSYSDYRSNGTTVRWTDSYAKAVGSCVLETFERLKSYGAPSSIRLVFWFYS